MFSRLITVLQQLEETVIILLLVIMTGLVFTDVVLRFGFGTGLIWSQELTLYLSAWFVLLGIGYGLRVGAHIGVDALVRRLPTHARRITTTLAIIMSLGYCGLFLYGAWIYLSKMYTIGISMEDLRLPAHWIRAFSSETLEALRIDPEDPLIPLWFAQSGLLIGLGIFTLRLLELLWVTLSGRGFGFAITNEAESERRLAEEIAESTEHHT